MDELVLKELREIKTQISLGTKQVLGMDEAAALIGISKSHLYKLCCAHSIAHFKSAGGKFTFFDKDELTAWCLHRRVKTTDEVEEDVASRIVSGKPHRIKKR
jgi:excisionase family DNA binding protein